MRTAASQELLRVLPVQVKSRLCVWATPLLTRKICAVPLPWLMAMLVVLPPTVSSPGSVSEMVPELSAMFELPVTPLTLAEPSHPATSFTRFKSPERVVVMFRR